MKIYYVYAERHQGEYGRSDFGYWTSKKKAKKAKEDGMKSALKDKENSYGYSVDGYYESDWYIEEIEVK